MWRSAPGRSLRRAALLAWLGAHDARVSQLVQMRSLLVAPSGERQLVELRAVDRAWPLAGAPVLDPMVPVGQALARRDGMPGLLADPVVLDRLRLKPGDTARLGTETFRVAARLVSEPDRVAGPVILGAPVIIRMEALAATGLDVPGALVSHSVRVVSGDPDLAAEMRAAFPDQGWRIRTPGDAAPGVGRFIDQATLFLTLVGFTALLVGGIGVANGVRAWLAAREQTVAILRCLGASSGLVLAVCLVEVMALAGLGILIGVAIGAAVPALCMGWLGDVLPVPPVGGVYAGPLALAIRIFLQRLDSSYCSACCWQYQQATPAGSGNSAFERLLDCGTCAALSRAARPAQRRADRHRHPRGAGGLGRGKGPGPPGSGLGLGRGRVRGCGGGRGARPPTVQHAPAPAPAAAPRVRVSSAPAPSLPVAVISHLSIASHVVETDAQAGQSTPPADRPRRPHLSLSSSGRGNPKRSMRSGRPGREYGYSWSDRCGRSRVPGEATGSEWRAPWSAIRPPSRLRPGYVAAMPRCWRARERTLSVSTTRISVQR